MPTYSFRNRETGEIHDAIMRIAAKEQFLLDNPQLEQVITGAPAFAGDHITIKKDSKLVKNTKAKSFLKKTFFTNFIIFISCIKFIN
jgi:hypothetical protein